jgi:hypothetical protein
MDGIEQYFRRILAPESATQSKGYHPRFLEDSTNRG